MSSQESTIDSIDEALESGDFESAVIEATALVRAGEPWLFDGLVRRALALEGWEHGPEDRLHRAADDWRAMIEVAPASLAYRSLARVLLKTGDRQSAFKNLSLAEGLEITPEVLLGYAQYFRTGSPPDLVQAKEFYLRAALRGRTQGIRGYAEMAYELNQPIAAASMAVLGLLATPFLALFLGERRHMGF